MFEARVEFGRIIDDEDDVSSVDKPLNNIIEWIRAVNLLAHFQDAWYFNDVALFFFFKEKQAKSITVCFLIRPRENSYLFEELARQSLSTQSVNERLAKFLETRESPVGSELSTVEHLFSIAVHQDLEEGGRRFSAC